MSDGIARQRRLLALASFFLLATQPVQAQFVPGRNGPEVTAESSADRGEDSTADLLGAIAKAGPSGSVVIDKPFVIARPQALVVPHGVSLVFRGEGRLITAFGAIQRLRITAHGAGYTAMPTVTAEGNAQLGAVQMGISQFRLAAPGTGYHPGDTLTLTGGIRARPATLTVAATQVMFASIATAGQGGTDGSHTITGTTGEGVPFKADVIVAGGAIRAVKHITRHGTYTRNPTNLAAEPVAGAGLTGASLRLEMGVGSTVQGRSPDNPTVYVSDFGSYTDLPRGIIPLAGGSGQGAALKNVTWHVQSIALADGGRYSGLTAPRITITGGQPRFAARAEAIGQAPTIDGPVIADGQPIVAGYGRLSGRFGGQNVEAAWFGADPTGKQDSTEALRAWAAAIPSPGGTGHCDAGTFLVSGTVLQRSGTTLVCEGARSVWKAADTFTGLSVPAYTFPFASIDNTMIANENYNVPFNPTQKVDNNLGLRSITFDYSAPSAKLVPGNKAIVYRMVSNATVTDIRCYHVGNCTTMMASDKTHVLRLYARGVANAAADHWESPRNALVEDADIDMSGDPFGRTLYGVLFTGTDTATRFGAGSGNTIRGGRITGFADAALWSDYGIDATTVTDTLIDCNNHARAVGVYITGVGGGHQVAGARFRDCARPVVFTNMQRDAWPTNVTIRNVEVEGQKVSPPFALNGTRMPPSAIAAPLTVTIDGARVRYAPSSEKPLHTISPGPGVRVLMEGANALEPGRSGILPQPSRPR